MRILSFFRPRSVRSAHARPRKILFVEELEDRRVLSAAAAGAEIHLLATPNDSQYASQWDMAKIQAPTAWNSTTGSLKVVVADIDTGIDYTHVDLYKNVWINQNEIPAANKAAIKSALNLGASDPITFWDLNNLPESQWNATTIADSNADHRIDARDVLAGWADGSATEDSNGYVDDLVGWNFVTNSNNPFDDNGHGSHTAGTIGAMGNNGTGVAGVNWQVQVMALKILDNTGSGDLFDAAEAIRYAAANGAQVSNNSWGFYDSGETVSGTKYSYLYNAIKETPTVLFVAAAGNNGLNNDTHWARNYPSSYNLSNVVAVAATNSRDGKPSWSNYGKTTVDLGAPGDNILSTVPGGYAYYSGTSMATPHVAGAAALALAKYPTLGTSALKSALISGVDIVGSMSKTVSGGRLNLNKVLNAAASAQSASSSDGAGSSPTGGSGGARGKAAKQSLPGSGPLSDDDASSQTFLLADAGSYQVTGSVNAADFAGPTTIVVALPIPAGQAGAPAWLALSRAGSGAGTTNLVSDPDTDEPDWEIPVNVTASSAPETTFGLAHRVATNGARVTIFHDAPAPAVVPFLDVRLPVSEPSTLEPAAVASPKNWGKAFGLAAAIAFFGQGLYFGRDARKRTDDEPRERRPVLR